MLLKPLKSKSLSASKVISASEPVTRDKIELAESLLYLRENGRLLILPILNHEKSVRFDKINHDSYRFNCVITWPRCNCNYAKLIRGLDIGFEMQRTFELSEVI